LSAIPAPIGTMMLPDGRALAYDDVGDAGGVPVVYLHGCPDCRLSRPPDARVDGVRLIAVDRPGYGHSDADLVGDEITQADDVVALADALGIDRFAVLGWSSGGPGALALGARHASRITAVGVAAGPVPMVADPEVWDAIDPVITMRGETMESMTPDEFAATVAPLLAPLDATFELMMEAVTEGKDAAYLRDLASVGGLHEQLALGAIAAVERGLAGAERDMRAMVSPWPFELADVAVPVVLWYGTEDHRFKPPVGQWLADRIPDARLEVFDGTSHLLPLVHWMQVMNDLLVLTQGLTQGEVHAPQP
jgi:pimeloyl-ACP methyl ester carboxylesterase